MTLIRCGISTFIVFASISFLPMAAADDLGQDCNPRGWVQMLRAWWDPVGFWSAQPAAIQKEVESSVKAYQLYLVQRQADVALAANEREKARIERATLEEQLRILGAQVKPVPPETQQALDQAYAKTDEAVRATYASIDEVQRQMAERAIRWGEKCMTLSREHLARARR
jgi:hypothetical protein